MTAERWNHKLRKRRFTKPGLRLNGRKLGRPLSAGSAWLICMLSASFCLAADSINVKSVLLNLLEEVKVPAQQEGVLLEIVVKQGEIVEEGAELVRIDDEDARLSVDGAKLELAITEKKMDDSFDLRTAEVEHRVASKDLSRAVESKAAFDRSVSAAEIDRYQLLKSRSEIDIERFRFSMEISSLTHSLRKNQLLRAEQKLKRYRIVAPIGGMVVDLNRQRGEWVEPGEPIMRIVRMDRLRADGYIHVDQLHANLKDSPVSLTVSRSGLPQSSFAGQVVFVSPEVNPVDGKVRVSAEIINEGLRLRPGLNAQMTINVRGD